MRVDDVDDIVRRTWVLPVSHVSTGLPIDVVLGASGLEEQFVARARRIDLGGVTVPVISPEDLVVSKLLAGRPKDLEDVVGVIQLQADQLDLGQVRALLSQLEQALDQSDLLPALERALRRARGA